MEGMRLRAANQAQLSCSLAAQDLRRKAFLRLSVRREKVLDVLDTSASWNGNGIVVVRDGYLRK